ncbi:hypothetical protein SK128_010609 [Halocaridina rubra]|uniref:VLIG-type G domain-containing protein n=1 Tax=Halocaridina rubra TaxID=373956 RepID=A0AAN8XCY3_HALRR
MEMELGDCLKRFGLGIRWLWLFRSLEIKTVSEVKVRVRDQKLFKELRRNARANEAVYFDNFIQAVTGAQNHTKKESQREDEQPQASTVAEKKSESTEGDDFFIGQALSDDLQPRSIKQKYDIERNITESRPSKVLPKHIPVEDLALRSYCLRLFLENSALDPKLYCNLLEKINISSLRDLQTLFQDKLKFAQFLKGFCERGGENLPDILNENIDTAVKQEELLHKLGLIRYYPGKITLPLVMKRACNKVTEPSDIPWYVLSKLILLDYRGRDDISPKTEESNSTARGTQNNSENDLENLFSELSKDPSVSSAFAPHPMDVLALILHCSSNFLRQVLCEKLFLCKLSVPYALPPFLNGKPLMLIWALRNIVLKDTHSNGEAYHRSAVNSPTMLVSCIRLGNESRSKANLLNEILNGRTHDTYFHKDCLNGMVDRVHSRGLIELAWYFPSSKEMEKRFNHAILFMNHRGNGESISSVSKCLLKESNVILVMTDVWAISKPNILSVLKSLSSGEASLILILSKNPKSGFDLKCKEVIRHCAKEIASPSFSGENIILDFVLNGEKNIKDLGEEAMHKINKCLEMKNEGICLEDLKDVRRYLNITIDEDNSDCTAGQNMAKKLLSLDETEAVDLIKSKLLPLQCKPWQEWAKLNKETHRLHHKNTEETRSEYITKLQAEMLKWRAEQFNFIKSMDKFMQTFLNDISKAKEYERLYYLKWVQFYLDDISRKSVPLLQKKYGSVMEAILQFQNDDQTHVLQKQLEALESQMSEASFGLEHLLREIGQTYEAACNSDQEIPSRLKEIIDILPQVVADILVRGYPLELMDGDASHVPVTWIRAVFHHLGNIIGKQKKIFVLSVLGVQSSGKSTLLNTMLGLQFAVGAGRCTKGVYAQLIPLEKDNLDITYDYMLVVDTEGLRAPELGKGKHEHDNEIATLVIGLGDVTIVNVKGENVAEMEDVLQIVVHAMLKMRLVNRSLKLQPSIVFIHQNVGAPDAALKLKSGQHKLIETLNKVTKAAGEQEDATVYTKFKQIIEFDINKHIHYFSDLWMGDPPMAPVNYGYSEKALSIKESLVKDIMAHRGSNLNIPKISLRIEDLWNGILDQNFVLSFKNSLSMKVYTVIERVLTNMKWSLTSYRMKWLSKKSNTIMGHEKDLDELLQNLTTSCHSDLEKQYNQVREELTEFFQKTDEQEVYEQWKDSTLEKLKESYNENVFRAVRGLEIMISDKKMQDERHIQKHKENLFKEAKHVAQNLVSESNISEEALEEKFEDMWKNWMSNAFSDIEKDDVDIHKGVMNVLYNHYRKDQALLQKIINDEEREKIKMKFIDTIKFHIAKQVNGIQPAKDVTTVIDSLKSLFSLKESEVERPALRLSVGNMGTNRSIVHMFIKKLYGHIRSSAGKLMPQQFDVGYARALIHLILSMVKELEKLGVIFNSTESFAIDISVRSSWLACYEFSKSQNTEIHSRQQFGLTGRSKHVINMDFTKVLYETFPDSLDLLNKAIDECATRNELNAHSLVIDIDKAVVIASVQGRIINKQSIKKDITNHVNGLKEEIKQYIEDTEVQEFKEEYVHSILCSIDGKLQEIEHSQKRFKFTKQFRIRLGFSICHYVIPMFSKKHKQHREKVHPRTLLEKKYKTLCLEMFKEHYKQSGKVSVLASVVSKLLVGAIEHMVHNDMARLLMDDLRLNVGVLSNKSVLIPSILGQLLEGENFEDFYLLFNDFNASFEKWIKTFVDNYLFISEGGHKTRYAEIASEYIKNLISQFCDEFEFITEEVLVSGTKNSAFKRWLKLLQDMDIEELQLIQTDLLKLTNEYRNIDISHFMKHLKSELESAQDIIAGTFESQADKDLTFSIEDSVYSLISQYCKGCKAKCPFCHAPCALSSENHIAEGMNHIAMEHYPLGCAGVKWQDDQCLLTESCPALVASDLEFENEDTDYEPQAYRDYKSLYPHWDIHSDALTEISDFWKWFMVQYSEDLADRYHAEVPAIPGAWRKITMEMAKESLEKYGK